MINRILFWDPCVSPHKSDFFSELSKIAFPIEIVCIAHADVPNERKAMGWTSPPAIGYTRIVSPSPMEIKVLVEAEQSAFHVFSGTRHLDTLVIALKAVRRLRQPFAIMAEPRVNEGWLGALRFAQSWATEGWLRKQVSFVLAIGRNGPPWFQSVGYPAEKIYPFGYFVNAECCGTNSPVPRDNGEVHIGYVGRLIDEKGVADIIESVSLLKNAKLTIVGSGPSEGAFRRLASKLLISVEFRGNLPISDIPSEINKFDALVLASRTKDDGWGVVVSEALLSGTAAIATNCVGASILLDRPELGRCVFPKDAYSIANALLSMQVNGEFEKKARRLRKDWAKSRITSKAGAAYFLGILDHSLNRGERPSPFYE